MRIAIPYQRNPFVKNTIHADTDNPDGFTIQTTEETTRLLEYCKQRREQTENLKKDGLVHMAEIPVFIYEKAVSEGWDTPEGWRRWLNDPDNAMFRTSGGRA